LPTDATRDILAAKVEVVSWPAAARTCLCSGTMSTRTAEPNGYSSGCRINILCFFFKNRKDNESITDQPTLIRPTTNGLYWATYSSSCCPTSTCMYYHLLTYLFAYLQRLYTTTHVGLAGGGLVMSDINHCDEITVKLPT